jgi:hypothetical protein
VRLLQMDPFTAGWYSLNQVCCCCCCWLCCAEVDNACTPGNNPCDENAYCTDRDPPLTGAVCVCKEGFTGSGTTCTKCTGTQWSPGGAVPCTDFGLHSQYFGTQTTDSQSRSLRSVATNGTFMYVGMIQVSLVRQLCSAKNYTVTSCI